VSAFFISS